MEAFFKNTAASVFVQNAVGKKMKEQTRYSSKTESIWVRKILHYKLHFVLIPRRNKFIF